MRVERRRVVGVVASAGAVDVIVPGGIEAGAQVAEAAVDDVVAYAVAAREQVAHVDRLVAAAPQQQRRVMLEPAHHVLGFAQQGRHVPGSVRDVCPADRKVLPDQDSAPVHLLVQPVIVGLPWPPDAQPVHMGAFGVVEDGERPLAVPAVRGAPHRRDAGAPQPDRLAVDTECEVAGHVDLAEPDRPRRPGRRRRPRSRPIASSL